MNWLTESALKAWGATLVGLVLGILQVIVPLLKDGRFPTKVEWAFAIGSALMGICSRFVNIPPATK